MTYARSQLVDESTPGFYHCMSRCVRRSFLCGEDHYSGQNFDHRKVWIEERLFLLAECFSVSLYAYAVMSNHLHVVLRVDPTTAGEWSDQEVARRWVRAFPGCRSGQDVEAHDEARLLALLANPDKVQEIRRRLGSLSWFMRSLNEPIARMANHEDHCTGRFWEGRPGIADRFGRTSGLASGSGSRRDFAGVCRHIKKSQRRAWIAGQAPKGGP